MHILRERFGATGGAAKLSEKRKPPSRDAVGAECGNPFTQIARKICKSEKQIAPAEQQRVSASKFQIFGGRCPTVRMSNVGGTYSTYSSYPPPTGQSLGQLAKNRIENVTFFSGLQGPPRRHRLLAKEGSGNVSDGRKRERMGSSENTGVVMHERQATGGTTAVYACECVRAIPPDALRVHERVHEKMSKLTNLTRMSF